MSDELKLCPICGSNDVFTEEKNGTPRVYCANCLCVDCYSPDAVKDWNSRPRDAELERQLEECRRERDEADRRAGAAERRLEYAEDALQKNNAWFAGAKEQWGVSNAVSFDDVWAEILGVKSKLDTATARAERYREALKDENANLRTKLAECQRVRDEIIANREARLKHFSDQLLACELGRDTATARAERYREALVFILGNHHPWPLIDVLSELVKAATHLLDDHQCDCQGYENWQGAKEYAECYVENIKARAALADKEDK